MKRIATCCFTGHRPEKMNCSGDIVIQMLRDAIEDAFSDGFTDYISGMSRGFDIWAAEAVLELRKEYSQIRLICAVPFYGFERGWETDWIERYRYILSLADEICYISDRYSRGSYQKRNKWMIDHSVMVIAGYNGAPGGTRNTLKYAKKQSEYMIRYLKL